MNTPTRTPLLRVNAILGRMHGMKTTQAIGLAAVLFLAGQPSPFEVLSAADGNPAPSSAAPLRNSTNGSRDPNQVVRMYRWDVPFATLAAEFSQADIPSFVAILNDDNRPVKEQSGDWNVALGLIWRLSSRNNDQVAADLLAAFKRPMVFQQFTNNLRDLRDVIMSRRNILEAMGRVGGTNAEAILRQALTKEGAKELSKAWFSGVPAEVFPPENLLGLIRGEAAMGLVYIHTPEALDLVRAEYQRERQSCVAADKVSRYYNYLASAMARLDALRAMGYDRNQRAPMDGTETRKTMDFINNYSLALGAYESDPVIK